MARFTLVMIVAGLAAAPAAAQIQPPPDTGWAERMMDRPRQLGIETELNALDAQLRTEANLAALRAQVPPSRLSSPPEAPGGTPSPQTQTAWPSIPDASLAASRARIEAILSERR